MQASEPDYKFLYERSQLEILQLKHELQQLKKMIFGSRHERFIPTNNDTSQLDLGIQTESVAKL